jgi:hypothetical protein
MLMAGPFLLQNYCKPLLSPHVQVSRDRELFITALNQLHGTEGGNGQSLAKLNKQTVDLHLLYNKVTSLGGSQIVTDMSQWSKGEEGSVE